MNYAVVDVRMSEVSSKRATVAPWEVPILRAIHGDGVVVVDEVEVDREPPDATTEYRRLASRYSGNQDETETAVAAVYGTFDQGIAKLAKEIDRAAKTRKQASAN